MSQIPAYADVLFRRGKYLLSLAILLSVAALFENCHMVDDDNINAICTADCTRVQGRFTTKDGNTPVPHMRLHLNWSDRDVLGVVAWTRKIAITETDRDGNYSFSFFIKDEELTSGFFHLSFDVPDNTYLQRDGDEAIRMYLDRKDTTITRNYHLPKLEAQIRIRLTNPEALSPDDRLICNIVFKYDDLSRDNMMHGIRALDAPDLTEGAYLTAADQYTYIRIAKRKNGQDVCATDSLIAGTGQNINYDVVF